MSRLSARFSTAHPAAPPGSEGGRVSGRRRFGTAVAVLGLTVAMAANTGNIAQALGFVPRAAVPPITLASSTQFDITGFIQTATVDNLADPHSGGVITVNGHRVVIPKETVVILPASALTWQELFTQAPAPWAGSGQTGMALADTPKPLTTYEAHIVGNRVINAAGDRYIAGLVNISQQDLNQGNGYVNFIDYGTGTMEVGGRLGVADTGTKVRINDPENPTSGSGGRYGRAESPDTRFQVDQDNPTIAAETGYPMCIPRTDPAGATPDGLCPEDNRPVVNAAATDQSGITPQPNALVAGDYYRVFRMDNPAVIDQNGQCLRPGHCSDPRKQAPFEIGDWVTFAGTIEVDAAGAQYVSAHTITASLGIYTQPGTNPAYVTIEVGLIGTGGLTVFGAGEAAVRTRIEGMSTDETRLVRLYAVDINPQTGATTDREYGTILPDPGPPNGAVRGRWRFRPPCTAAVATDKACTPAPAGTFLPPPREIRAVIDGFSQYKPGTWTPNPASQIPGDTNIGAHPQAVANGLFWGQYHAPIEEYIFPENVPGSAVPENNFNTIPFLAYGGYASVIGTQVGQLDPWPSNVVPTPLVCANVSFNGVPYSVAGGGSLQLSGGAQVGATGPLSVSWTAGTVIDGTDLNAQLTNASTTTPTFSAAGLQAGTYQLALTVQGPCGVTKGHTTITVTATPPPAINPVANQTVTANNLVTLTATSSAVPAPTWTWTQTGGPVLPAFPVNTAAGATSTVTFTPTVAGTYTFRVTATNVNGTSAPVNVTVTVTAATTTNVTLNNEYRTGKQRLIITATANLPANTVMTLQPYLTENGTTFDPTTLGANLTISLTAPGTWTLTAVGAPRPACNLGGAYATPCAQKPLTVKAFDPANTLIGTSAASGLDRIRT